jgi:type VI secretion system protein ImpI
MYLALQVTSPNGSTLGQNASKVFGPGGGTIGRVAGNDWVLPDPERFISSRHAIIRFMNSTFSLEDVSVNGTFVNGGAQAVGAGNEPMMIRQGDRIQIGDYEMFASIVESADDLPGANMVAPDPMMTSPPTGSLTSPTSPTMAPAASSLGPVDPLDMLGAAPPPPPPAAPGAMPNHSSATSDAFIPPGPIGDFEDQGGASGPAGGGGSAIPDDWDLTGFSPSPSKPPTQAAIPPAAPTHAAPPPAPDLAAGMPHSMPPHTSTIVGSDAVMDRIMPLIVQGMMDVLQSRAEIKSQFRLALTTIKPVENNPLKFSPTAPDAMKHLFGGENAGYLDSVEAFEEGFNDIKAHQMAMIAGMRAAFEHMLSQFSPRVLEARFQGGSKRGGIMSIANKVRYWEMYREMFERLSRDSDDNFRELFGEEFATAYEEQMQKITKKT